MVCGLIVYKAYLYKSVGLLRSISGLFLSFFSLRWRSFWMRLMVILNFRPDPYDTYDHF